MGNLEHPDIEEIHKLHDEIVYHMRRSLEKAMMVNELLYHDTWRAWVAANSTPEGGTDKHQAKAPPSEMMG